MTKLGPWIRACARFTAAHRSCGGGLLRPTIVKYRKNQVTVHTDPGPPLSSTGFPLPSCTATLIVGSSTGDGCTASLEIQSSSVGVRRLAFCVAAGVPSPYRQASLDMHSFGDPPSAVVADKGKPRGFQTELPGLHQFSYVRRVFSGGNGSVPSMLPLECFSCSDIFFKTSD